MCAYILIFVEVIDIAIKLNNCYYRPHQWRSANAQNWKTWEVPGSNPGCACRPSLSEFSVVFSETRVNTG